MRLHLRLTPNTEPVPFNYRQFTNFQGFENLGSLRAWKR